MNDGTAEMPTEMITFWRPTPEDGDERQREEEAREREEDVGEPLDHEIGESALEAGDRAEGHADRDAQPDGEEADQEGEPAAVEEPGQDVAPEMVGPERVRPGETGRSACDRLWRSGL